MVTTVSRWNFENATSLWLGKELVIKAMNQYSTAGIPLQY
jgi:hypothetical protein